MNKLRLMTAYFINRPFHMKLFFIFTFILYGAIISFTSYKISDYYQSLFSKSKLIDTQEKSLSIKENELRLKISRFSNEINALKDNKSFKSYIKNKDKKENVLDLFSVIMDSNKELSQLRFIDINGNEKIRFDRKSISSSIIKVEENELQNKISRYYFTDIKNSKKDTIWYSKLDLNVEHGEIQKPIVPTLRMGTPIYSENGFEGIIIMNIFFKNIIEKFVDSALFHISIYDKDGDFIYHKHTNEKNKSIDKSWSKYLKNDFNMKDYKNHIKDTMLNQKELIINKSIHKIIPNSDNLSVFYEPKIFKLEEIEANEKEYLFTVTLIVLLLSLPLSLVLGIIPISLNNELFETKKILEEEIDIVDKHVLLSVADLEGRITDISSAYAKLIGYTKDELIGQKYSILKHPETKKSLYTGLWKTILSKKIWKGEFKNLKKDSTSFDIEVVIKPNVSPEGEIFAFTSYIKDITYQKEIERISITDEMTGLYNRREFDKVFTNYIENAKRYKHSFSMMILDIDYFKQYNDTYGHLEGDNVIKIVAKEIQNISTRSTDLAFRLGGEEFGLLFSSNNKEDAIFFANKLRNKIENLNIEHKNSKSKDTLTISAGVFFIDKVANLKESEIFKLCDEALYVAKESGRNQVSLAKV